MQLKLKLKSRLSKPTPVSLIARAQTRSKSRGLLAVLSGCLMVQGSFFIAML